MKIAKLSVMTSAIAIAMQGVSVHAQDAQEGPADEAFGDIIVTARKTEESLQRTPVAVTAVTSETLVAAGVRNVVDLQQTAPGLTVARGSAGTAGIAFVAIRGQGNLQPILSNDPAVATYIDGVYIPRPTTAQSDLGDLQRVEVLRGPQGTLFGRNTTGGAINILTKDPTDTFGGELLGEVGNRAQVGAGLTLNTPIGENLAARVSYSFRDSNGIGDDPNVGRPVGDRKSHAVRGKIKYSQDSFSLVLAADYVKMTDNGQLTQLAAINPDNATLNLAAFAPVKALLQAGIHTNANYWTTYATGVVTPAAGVAGVLSQDALDYYANNKPFNILKTYGTSATVSVDIGSLTVKSISAYRKSHDFALSDTDGTAAPLLGTFAGSDSRYISQEFQLSGKLSDALSFLTGLYYGDEKGAEFSRSQIFGGRLRNSISDIASKTFGMYLQGNYQITDSVRATGGFRYTWDKRNTILHNQQVFGLPANAPVAGTPFGINCTVTTPDQPVTATDCNQTQKASFSYPAWTFGLDWQASDNLFLYAKTSGAAKAGGWNIRAGGLPAFAPEKVKDIEVGLKADIDRRLRINIAGFYLWKSKNQAIVNSFVPGIGVTQYIQNNGDTRTYGVEAELTANPWEGMIITTNASFADGHYKAGSFKETQILSASDFANCNTPNASVTNGCFVDLSKQPIIQLPEVQLNLAAEQSVPVTSDITMKLWGNYAYIGSQTFLAANIAPASTNAALIRQTLAQNALGTIPGYGIFNARVAFELAKPNVELAFAVRNLANKKYIVRSFADLYTSIGFSAEYAGAPRLWTASLTYKF